MILFEMLVGYPPFFSDEPSVTFQKILHWRRTFAIPTEANLSVHATDILNKLIADPEVRLGRNGADEIKAHPFFEGFTHNPAAISVGLGQSGSNKNLFDNAAQASSTNILGSGGKLPGSRARRIESRKGILSRKSSVNKNSFYK